MSVIGKVLIEWRSEVKKVQEGFKKVSKASKRIQKESKKGAKQQQKYAKGMQQGFSGMTKKVVGFIGAYAGIRTLVSITKSVFNATKNLETKMSDISTLISGESTEAVNKLRDGLLGVADAVPKTIDDLGGSLYDILSAGVQGSANQLNVLRESAKLATAGLGDTKGATDIMTSAINAFGLNAEDSNKIADVLFKTVKFGKTTVEKMSEAFGATAPIIADAGFKLEDFSAATAALTTTGMPAAQAQNSLRQAIVSLVKPTKEMKDLFKKMGVEGLQEMIDKGMTMGDIFRGLTKAADGSKEMLTKAVGSVEAYSSVVGVGGTVNKAYTTTLREMMKGSNAINEAFEKQKNTFESTVAIVKNKLNKVMVKLGSSIMPIVKEVLEKMMPLFDDLADWVDTHSDEIAELSRIYIRKFVKAVEGAGRTIAKIVRFFQKNEAALVALKGALRALITTWIAFKAITAVSGINSTTRSLNVLTQVIGRAGKATKGATGATAGFSGALGGLTGIIASIGIGVAIASLAAFKDEINKGAKATQDMLFILEDFETISTETFDNLEQGAEDAKTSWMDFGKIAGKIFIADIPGAIKDINKEYGEWNKNMEDTNKFMYENAEAFGVSTEEISKWIDELGEYEAFKKFGEESAKRVGEGLSSLDDAYDLYFEKHPKANMQKFLEWVKTTNVGGKVTDEVSRQFMLNLGKMEGAGKALAFAQARGMKTEEALIALNEAGVTLTRKATTPFIKAKVKAKQEGQAYTTLMAAGLSSEEALARIGSSGGSVVNALRSKIKSEDPRIRRLGINTLIEYAGGVKDPKEREKLNKYIEKLIRAENAKMAGKLRGADWLSGFVSKVSGTNVKGPKVSGGGGGGGGTIVGQHGGFVDKPTMIMAGEKNRREAIVPLESDRQGKRDREKLGFGNKIAINFFDSVFNKEIDVERAIDGALRKAGLGR